MSLRLVPPPPERDRYERDGLVFERVSPADCARDDLPYEDWLALPEATIVRDKSDLLGRRVLCPVCGGGHWGAINGMGYLLVYACHDQRGIGCRARFRGVDGETHDLALAAVEVVFAALAGIGKTFCVGKAVQA